MDLHKEEATETIIVDNAHDFLSYLRRSHDRWWKDASCPWIFRGHWDSTWQLSASAFRDGESNPLRGLIAGSRKALESSGVVDPDLTVRSQYLAECEAIAQFAELARDAKIAFSGRMARPSDAGVGKQAPYREPSYTREDGVFDHLCPALELGPLAQHHGVPTRLIDFTRDSILAAFFATVAPLLPPVTNPQYLCVWAFDTSNWCFRQFLSTLVFIDGVDAGVDVDPFILAQGGCFILLKQAAGYFIEHRSWPTILSTISAFIEEMNRGETAEANRWPLVLARSPCPFPILRQICLPHSEVVSLRGLLEREGVSLAHLMPTLDNVANTLKTRWAAS